MFKLSLKKTMPLWVGIVMLLLVTAACLPSTNIPVTGAVETAALQTVGAQMTQSAFQTLVAQLTQVANESMSGAQATQIAYDNMAGELTRIAQVPTDTATPTATFTPTHTATPLPPTATFTPPPTNTPLPATATPIPCYKIQFVADVTVPDGTSFRPNQSFVKTWRIKNAGTCTWTSDFDVVFVSGNSMGASAVLDLNANVLPNQTADVSVSMVAPSSNGSYEGFWMLRSGAGVVFGLGANADKAFWVKINVNNPSGAWTSGHAGAFVYDYCAADWRSATSALGCPGGENFNTGSVSRTDKPKLEGGYIDDELTIISIPSSGEGGMISGTFPSFKVGAGKRFYAIIGCLDGSPNCNATIQVNYSIDGGAVNNLGTWTETSNGTWTTVNIDLGFLADKNVQFTLKVSNNGSSQDDRIFWLAARVE